MRNGMTKEEARSFVKAKKSVMTQQQIDAYSQQIFDILVNTDIFLKSENILTYVSYNQEVKTLPFIKHCLLLGKNVFVPKVYGMEMHFHKILDLSELKPGKYGILEPDNGHICVPDTGLMVMPGLAFDKEHNRVGYGGGFYDRYLAAHPDFFKAAAAFSFQITDGIETDDYDLKPDIIITEQGIL